MRILLLVSVLLVQSCKCNTEKLSHVCRNHGGVDVASKYYITCMDGETFRADTYYYMAEEG